MLYQLFTAAQAADPITALLTRDYAAIGGWSLFIGLVLVIVTGSFREWWVPGARYRRLEVSAKAMSDANDELSKQNGQLIQQNELSKYFFQVMLPKREEQSAS